MLSNARYRTALCLALAAVFMYAGLAKIAHPLDFADNIYGFAILPPDLIGFVALGLPVFEIASALLLIASPTRRIGALSVAIASLIFWTALLSALLRGLTLDCGCFGSGAPSRPRMWTELGLDTALLWASSAVYRSLLATHSDRSVAKRA